jgi:hypothetical protein
MNLETHCRISGVDFVRQFLFAGLFVVGLVAIASPSFVRSTHGRVPAVAAADPPDRYCLQGIELVYPGNCEFSTYEQCGAAASGTGDGCGENPQYLLSHYRPLR